MRTTHPYPVINTPDQQVTVVGRLVEEGMNFQMLLSGGHFHMILRGLFFQVFSAITELKFFVIVPVYVQLGQ